MNMGLVAQPNAKGQMVIPKKIRDKFAITEKTFLNISVNDHGFFVHPIDKIEQEHDINREVFLAFLKTNRGRWGKATKEGLAKEKRQRKLELEASKRRKQAW